MKIYKNHILLLEILVNNGEMKYQHFKSKYSPWKHERHFDGEMKKLYKRGYVDFGTRTSIEITDAGVELFEKSRGVLDGLMGYIDV